MLFRSRKSISPSWPIVSPSLQGSFDARGEAIAAAGVVDGEAKANDTGAEEESGREMLFWFDPYWFGSLVAGSDVKWETEVVAGPISVSH